MNLQFTFISRAIEQMLGYTVEEFLKMPLKDIFVSDSHHLLADAYVQEMLLEARPDKDLLHSRIVEVDQIRKDGRKISVEIKMTFIRDATETPIGILGFSRDITDQKIALQALRESEEKYRFMTENITDVIWQISSDFKFIFVSPAIKLQRGYEPEEAIGKSIFDFMTPESAAVVKNSFLLNKDLIYRGLTRESQCLEIERITKNGQLIWTEIIYKPLYDQDDQFMGFQGATRDITARKTAEKERERIIAELEKALNEVKTLRGFISICSNCKKIRTDKGSWEQIEKYIQDHSEASFSHGICPDCVKELYPDLYDKVCPEPDSSDISI
ncbi:MAG: PAS domain-containing protein [Deltaproteobacteria bacterium]|nr:PAS domain-containing protein [Deltaproteobacteria bacterium]